MKLLFVSLNYVKIVFLLNYKLISVSFENISVILAFKTIIVPKISKYR